MSSRRPVRTALGAAVFALAMRWAPDAHAAGGLFPHETATPASIAVNKVTAVIVPDPGSAAVELHVQLSFEVDQPELLAWVVPLPSAGTVRLGSQRLLSNLDAATIVTFQTTVVPAQCAEATDPAPPPVAPTPGNPGPPDLTRNLRLPAVAEQSQPVGASVVDWLLGRGYVVTASGNALLGAYQAGGSSSSILEVPADVGPNITYPVVFRFENGAVTLPTTLLALNAGLGVPIDLYVLARGRGTPQGARHVVLNPLRVDWLRLGDNYRALIGEAMQDPAIDGEGMVTDAVVPALDVAREGLWDPRWNVGQFPTLPASSVPNALIDQGLYTCPELGTCEPQHPLIDRIVTQFFLPAGVTLRQYRENPTFFEETVQWQSQEFAAAFLDLIVEPGAAARAAVDRATTLTRMRAQVSTVDPLVRVWADGPKVPGRRRVTATERCDGDLVVHLPDGRDLYVPHSGPWPDLSEQMPAIDRVEQIPNEGNPTVVVDNRERIDVRLAEHNEANGWPVQGLLDCSVGARPRGAGWWLLLLLLATRRRGPARTPRAGSQPLARRLAPVVVALGLFGCKPAPSRTTAHPTAAPDIELALARNEQALRDAGIAVPAPQVTQPVTDPPARDNAVGEARARDSPTPSVVAPADPAVDYDELAEDDAAESSPGGDEPQPESVEPTSTPSPSSPTLRYRTRRRAESRRARAKDQRGDAARCDRICGLAEATCELAAHVCRLAEAHPEDPRYAESCHRGLQQCDAAQTACDHCT